MSNAFAIIGRSRARGYTTPRMTSLLPLVGLLLATGCASTPAPASQKTATSPSSAVASSQASATAVIMQPTQVVMTAAAATVSESPMTDSAPGAAPTEQPPDTPGVDPTVSISATDALATPVEEPGATGGDTSSVAAAPNATDAGALTPEEAAYLQKVEDLAIRITNATELHAPDQALQGATQGRLTGFLPNLVALNAALPKAITFMSGIAGEVQALQPPPHLQSVQAELQAVVDYENKHLTEEQALAAAPTEQKLGLAYGGTMTPAFALLGLQLDVHERKTRQQTGMAQLTVDGPLSPAETSYVNNVQGLVTRMSNSTELSDAQTAVTDAIDSGQQGHQLDTKAFNATFNKALAFMNTITSETRALQPPPRLQALQAELLKTVVEENSGLRDSQAVISTQNWANAGNIVGNMSRPMVDLMTIGTDLARLGSSSVSGPTVETSTQR